MGGEHLLYLEMGGAPRRAPGVLANASIVSDYLLEDTGGCRGTHGRRFAGTRGCGVVRATPPNPTGSFGNEFPMRPLLRGSDDPG